MIFNPFSGFVDFVHIHVDDAAFTSNCTDDATERGNCRNDFFEQIERIPNLERKRAPSVSKMNPIRKAIRRLIEPAPIGVPQEFAESFAPTAKARTKPKMTARV